MSVARGTHQPRKLDTLLRVKEPFTGGCSEPLVALKKDPAMRTAFAFFGLAALLLQPAAAPVAGGRTREGTARLAPAQDVPVAPQPARPDRGAELAALEQKLFRSWKGPDCGGDFTFNPDGTFEVRHYTPGNNTFTGAWALRWEALPPTLLLTFKTSDIKKRNPAAPEHPYVGKTLRAKLLELDNDTLAFRVPDHDWNWRTLPTDEK
jgi:hypothetical protein